MASRTRRFLSFANAHAWILCVVLCFSGVVVNKIIADHNRHVALQEICRFVDREHDRTRAQMVTDLKRIFRPPYTGSFKLSPEASHKAFLDTRTQYVHVIDTRPNFCDPRSKPIPPFPDEHAINPAA